MGSDPIFTYYVNRGGSTRVYAPIKYFDKGLSLAAAFGWRLFSAANRIHPGPSFIPKWSDKPLLKSWQKTKPPLGWPRQTDSLCPRSEERRVGKECRAVSEGDRCR